MIFPEKGSRALLGAWCLGILALVSDDEDERRAALAEGEAMLSERVVGHCHLWFYRDAMEACLNAGDFGSVERYADALATFTREEPLPWSDFFIARGQALAVHGRKTKDPSNRDRIASLLATAERIGMGTSVPALARALE